MAYYNGRKVFQVLRNVISSGTVVTVDGEPVETFNADTKLDNRVDNDYPELSVGEAAHANYADLADGIASDREVPNAANACPPIVIGTAGGDVEIQSGFADFENLQGNTVKWNQLNHDPTFADSNAWSGDNTVFENNKAIVTGTGSQSQSVRSSSSNPIPWINGHIYIFSFIATTTAATTNTQLRIYDGSAFSYPATYALSVGTRFCSARFTFAKTTTQTGSMYIYANLNQSGFPEGETLTIENLQVFDLTEIFGAGNEPETADDFFKLFPLPVYPYNAGTITSSCSSAAFIRGKNQFNALDEFIVAVPGETYEISGITAGGYVEEYDAAGNLIKTSSEITEETDFTLDIRTVLIKVQATTYTNIMLYVLWGTPGEPFEPYSATTVTLPGITLRSFGNVRDIAYSSGGGKRRIGERAYVSGDENDPSVWTDGTSTIYVLDEETDISYTENPGWENSIYIDNFGTIVFESNSQLTPQVPQAYFVRYTVSLVEFLDSAYVAVGGDPSEIATKSDINIPDDPTADGTYTLKVVVSGGVKTRSWVLDT